MGRATRSKSEGGAATIFDVAKQAGVSIKTVSRVVNREPNVRDSTREKVMTAVTALGYQPNAAARGLSGRRSFVIGLIYENADEFSYMKHILDGALAECEAQGYVLLLRPLTLPSPNVVRDIRTFATQARVDGLILPAPIGDVAGVRALVQELGLPVATITPQQHSPLAIDVLCDDAKASAKLTQLLVRQGHQRIGFIKGHPEHRASDERFSGYRDTLEALGMDVDERLVQQGYFTFASGQQAAEALLDLSDPPTAIMASNDDMAAGVYYVAYQRGLTIPGDLSIVGFDDTPVAARMWPPLTTAKQPIEAMAREATRLLVAKLSSDGDGEDEDRRDFQCVVVQRQSTRSIS